MDSDPEWRGMVFESAVGAALSSVSGGRSITGETVNMW